MPIVYGLQINDTHLKKEQAGEIYLGGIARSVDAPNWHCKECGHQFLR
ncbi:hypothetical protein [Nitratiruptor sp. YY09-18]|nr:hypothetical protein [Nitratiruptor sp. YY09-18]BCD68325.1 hypothetical protein NitYY0918_C1236 [Nitratiruptor sp. YY09-18]